ncbi:MAG: hypothetical protein JW895_00825 [Thermoleophilaceae bacterium]|nr:hypothetical protein [Thermoleophilaceae bacterium]
MATATHGYFPRTAGRYRTRCTHWSGCGEQAEPGWAFCETHHGEVVARGERLKNTPNSWRNR